MQSKTLVSLSPQSHFAQPRSLLLLPQKTTLLMVHQLLYCRRPCASAVGLHGENSSKCSRTNGIVDSKGKFHSYFTKMCALEKGQGCRLLSSRCSRCNSCQYLNVLFNFYRVVHFEKHAGIQHVMLYCATAYVLQDSKVYTT